MSPLERFGAARSLLALVGIAAIFGFCSAANAKVIATLRNNENEGDVARGVRGCHDAEDSFTLIVRQDDQLLVSQDYCSAYANSSVSVIEDAKGTSYLILRYGDGHGTLAVSKHIAVLRVGDGLALCRRQLVEQAAGLNAFWQYKYRAERPAAGGIKLILNRRIVGPDAEDFPRERTKIVEIDTPGNLCEGSDLKQQKLTGDGYREYPKGDDDYDVAPASHPLRRVDPQKH